MPKTKTQAEKKYDRELRSQEKQLERNAQKEEHVAEIRKKLEEQ